MLKLKSENIPEILKMKKQWVAIKVTPDGKKIPVSPNPEAKGSPASISNRDTWGTFEQAVAMVKEQGYDAIAFALVKEDKLIFVDVDCHIGKGASDEEKEKLLKQYKSMYRVVEQIGTYFETSLSGTGVHLIAQGELDEDLKTGSSPLMPIEIYTEKRFVIFTGHKLNDCDIDDSERTTGTIRNLHKNYFQKKRVSNGVLTTAGATGENQEIIAVLEQEKYTDEQVLKNASKDEEFKLLWEGNWSQVLDREGNQKFTQQHFSDFQLIRKLAFYTGNCKTQIERLFRQSPCYQQYGKNGKWPKYESDIRTDIEKATSTCTAVYNPSAHKEEWRPDYKAFYAALTDADENKRPFKNPALISILKDYINKHSGRKIAYLPYLFKEDRNINGATNIVKKVTGNKLKYSNNFNSYFRWDGKKFVSYSDADMLIHPLTDILELVEHSVFYWTMTQVANWKQGEDADGEENPLQAELEELAVKRFNDSKYYVSAKLANDALKKMKGMDVQDDIVKYYDTPYINMQNGVLNLLTRELSKHAPEYNLHKITNCNYNPDAKCPEFLSMVERLMPGEAERKELQKAFGLCLAKEHLPAKKVLLLMVGPTDTGKSTFLNTMLDVLGEYATSVDNSVLMQNGKDKSRGPEMYAFFEHLLITSSETNESDRLDVAKIKSLTGETMQSIRNNYATKMDQFRMTGLIAIDSNFHPYIPSRDSASWNRLRMFPFIQTVKKKDPTLKKKLEAERDGIFNWLLEGLDMILEEKAIIETPAMLEYKEQYKKEMDTTAQFLKDCIVQADERAFRIPTTLLFTAYKNWCSDNGFNASVRNKFYDEIGKVYERKKSGSEYYAGMKFTELGHLYCIMKEQTPQEFAKKKRAILEGYKLDLPYHVVRKIYYDKSKDWFYRMNDNTGREHYIDYCSWCAESGYVPIHVDDFMIKINYLKKYLDGTYIARQCIEDAKDVWYDRY